MSDGRYLYRHNDRNLPFSASDIEAIKRSRRELLTEAQFVQDATLYDLDVDLIARVAERAGIAGNVDTVLEHYRLAERVESRWAVSLAAVLLFAREPSRWHPRCGIDFAIWRGTERRSGSEFNIQKRLRIENKPLPLLIEQAHAQIKQYLPQRSVLVDLFFEEHLAYPEFAWQEAIVNAVAHRDYGLKGIGIEVDLFDDRLEVRSPGQLVEPVTIERLRQRERIHASRNPCIARVLTDFGLMRERGEGVPRMFDTMEAEGLQPPELSLEGGCFVVVLRSTPVYSRQTMQWLAQWRNTGLSSTQIRVIGFAQEHRGVFTSKDYQKLTGVDPYTASREIRELLRKGVVERVRHKGREYRVIDEPARRRELSTILTDEFPCIGKLLSQQGFITNREVCALTGLSRIQAYRLLLRLVEQGVLEQVGRGRSAHYRLKSQVHPSIDEMHHD